MKTILRSLLTFIGITVIFCSCASSKKIMYFQDIESKKKLEVLKNYEPTIKKDDLLEIIVSGPNKDVVIPYNLTIGERIGNSGGGTIPYQVDAQGYINFPIIGRLHVEGLTRRELVARLTAEISKDVKDPIVHVSFLNYRVTILGEVRAPGTYNLPSDNTTILQAIGMAGDLSITGKRTNILLLRENNGRFEYARIDLTKTDVLSSPHYYLSQNDVIYVAPVTARFTSATTPTVLISLVSSSVSTLVSILLFVLK